MSGCNNSLRIPPQQTQPLSWPGAGCAYNTRRGIPGASLLLWVLILFIGGKHFGENKDFGPDRCLLIGIRRLATMAWSLATFE
jgi:hypothetical protein